METEANTNPDEELDFGIDLLAVIGREAASNDDHKGGRDLLWLYEDCDQQGKAIVNTVLLAVCGWSLPTLKRMVTEPNYDYSTAEENDEQKKAPFV